MEATTGKVKGALNISLKANKNGQERRWECIFLLNALLSFPQTGEERSTAYFLRVISNLMIALPLAFQQSDSNLDYTNFPQSDCIKLKNVTPDLHQCEQSKKSGSGLLSSKESMWQESKCSKGNL